MYLPAVFSSRMMQGSRSVSNRTLMGLRGCPTHPVLLTVVWERDPQVDIEGFADTAKYNHKIITYSQYY